MMPRPIAYLASTNLRLNVLAQVAYLRLRSFVETYNRVYKVASRTSPDANRVRHHAAACLRLRSFVETYNRAYKVPLRTNPDANRVRHHAAAA